MGGRRLKCGLFDRYVIVGISEVFGHSHADLQSVTPALAHDPSVNYRTAPRPKRRGFKFEKSSSKRMRQTREKNVLVTETGGAEAPPVDSPPHGGWGGDPSDSSSREAAYGPVGFAYRYSGVIVATNGSLKEDGRMGAAFVSMGDRIPARSVAVVGSASSARFQRMRDRMSSINLFSFVMQRVIRTDRIVTVIIILHGSRVLRQSTIEALLNCTVGCTVTCTPIHFGLGTRSAAVIQCIPSTPPFSA